MEKSEVYPANQDNAKLRTKRCLAGFDQTHAWPLPDAEIYLGDPRYGVASLTKESGFSGHFLVWF